MVHLHKVPACSDQWNEGAASYFFPFKNNCFIWIKFDQAVEMDQGVQDYVDWTVNHSFFSKSLKKENLDHILPFKGTMLEWQWSEGDLCVSVESLARANEIYRSTNY